MPLAHAHYSSISIALHWLTLALLIGVYACMELRDFWPKGDPVREGMKSWHYTLGLTVWLLTLVRLTVRLGSTAPPIIPQPAAWQRAAAKFVHVALYVLLLAMPIGGWLILSAEGERIPFWFIDLPPLVDKSKELAEQIEYLHETGSRIGYLLIGLHASAALFHHYVIRDNAFARMLPARTAG